MKQSKSMESPADVDIRLVDDSTPPAVGYVNIMLNQMWKTCTPVRTLRSAEALTSISTEEVTIPAPPLPRVLNRLKVISGLDPVHYSEDVQGKIQFCIRQKMYDLRVTFNDEAEETCRIEFIGVDWKQNEKDAADKQQTE